MEDAEIIAATLNNTIARHAKTIQSYEIEIANLTAEVLRLKKKASVTKKAEVKEVKEGK